MARGILIFCERTGLWAASLRRELDDALIEQRETRSLTECREVLSPFPASLIVLELTAANLERAFEWLIGLTVEFPQSRVVALAQRGLEPHEWLARELGCLTYCTSPRQLKPVAELARRYFAMLPQPEMTFEEQVWARLPWKAEALGLRREDASGRHD